MSGAGPSVDDFGDLFPPRLVAADSGRTNSRAALVDAALEEFSEKGYDGATVVGIAARAGVTTGALYAHFASKLELLIAAIGLVPVSDLMRAASELTDLDAGQTVARLGKGLAATPDRRSLLLLDIVTAARRDPAIADVVRRGLDGYLSVSARATTAAATSGAVSPAVSADDLSRLLSMLGLGMLVFTAVGSEPPSADAFERLAELLLESDHPAPLDPLDRVEAKASRHARSQQVLHDAIVEAVGAGHSLRQVGAAAGVSHERVRQILRERDDT